MPTGEGETEREATFLRGCCQPTAALRAAGCGTARLRSAPPRARLQSEEGTRMEIGTTRATERDGALSNQGDHRGEINNDIGRILGTRHVHLPTTGDGTTRYRKQSNSSRFA